MTGYYVDKDSTDDFLDYPLIVYNNGLGFWESLAAQGYDASEASKLAQQLRDRGIETFEKPPLIDH